MRPEGERPGRLFGEAKKDDPKDDPPIWNEFLQILHDAGADVDLGRIGREKFYEAAGTPDVCLTIATGEQRIYANLLLTIGVIKPK
jgi:L-fucose mutarotase